MRTGAGPRAPVLGIEQPRRCAPPTSHDGRDGNGMNLPTTSVIVVSWQRPDALVLCLQSLVRQRLAPPYEIVVVADAAGLAAVASLPDAAQMKLVACDRPNISAARN